MLPTLILLYALDTGQIPKSCYIAAWIFTAIEYLPKIIAIGGIFCKAVVERFKW